jgi:hypothetical protein
MEMKQNVYIRYGEQIKKVINCVVLWHCYIRRSDPMLCTDIDTRTSYSFITVHHKGTNARGPDKKRKLGVQPLPEIQLTLYDLRQ